MRHLILKTVQTFPRRFIFFIDLMLTTISYVLINYLFLIFQGRNNLKDTLYELPFIVIVYAILFFIYKPYKSLIRNTSVADAFILVKVCIWGGIIIAILNFLNRQFGAILYPSIVINFSYSAIVLHSLINLTLLFYMRLVYKEIYSRFERLSYTKKRAVIYGAGKSGILTYQVLSQDPSIQIVQFVDDDPKKQTIKIFGLKVFPSHILTRGFIHYHKIDEIYLSIQNISRKDLFELTNALQNLPVVLKIIPPIEKWVNGKLTSKAYKELKIEDLLGREHITLIDESVNREIKGKVVLVTGAAGSIGSEISRQLSTKDISLLILLDKAESPLYDLQQELIEYNHKIKYVVSDVCNKDRIHSLFSEYHPQVVFHAAAYKHVPFMEEFPREAIHTNVIGTKNVADVSVLFQVEKFVMISTDKAVNPTNVMGATKRIAEIYVNYLNKTTSTKFIVTRFGNVLGSNGSVIPLFKKQIEKGGPLTVTHPDITRYFMTIPEACQLVLEAGAMGNGGEVFVFDMGESVKIMDLAKKMIALSGYNYPSEIDIEISGLRPGEKIFEELLTTDELTLPTHHKKIMIALINTSNIEVQEKYISVLCNKCMSSAIDAHELVEIMKTIVPEFKSQNSVYSILDK